MRGVTTAEMKAAYRKAVAGYLREEDPLKKQLYLRASYALKVDLSKRIKFKGKRPLWKRIVSNIEVVKNLNKEYVDDTGEGPKLLSNYIGGSKK